MVWDWEDAQDQSQCFPSLTQHTSSNMISKGGDVPCDYGPFFFVKLKQLQFAFWPLFIQSLRMQCFFHVSKNSGFLPITGCSPPYGWDACFAAILFHSSIITIVLLIMHKILLLTISLILIMSILIPIITGCSRSLWCLLWGGPVPLITQIGGTGSKDNTEQTKSVRHRKEIKFCKVLKYLLVKFDIWKKETLTWLCVHCTVQSSGSISA